MPSLRQALARYPAAAKLQLADIADTSLIDEIECSGFVRKLYDRNA